MPPTFSHAVPDEDLRDSQLASKCDKSSGRIAMAFEDFDRRVELPSDLEIFLQRRFILRRQVRLADIRHEQFTVKAIGVSPSALQDRTCIGSRSDAHQDALLRSPDLLDMM